MEGDIVIFLKLKTLLDTIFNPVQPVFVQRNHCQHMV